VVCGPFLIVKPTGYIARGFLLESTPRKHLMKLYQVVMPLYRPGEHVFLNYSTMISGGHAGLFWIDEAAKAESAAAVLSAIGPHIEMVERLRSPRDFLGYISWMAGTSVLTIRMDFGLTHYLLGNIREALIIFRGIDMDSAGHNHVVQERYGPWIKQILDLLERQPEDLRHILDQWRAERIHKLRLEASVSASTLNVLP
jgi:hypothetical protein